MQIAAGRGARWLARRAGRGRDRSGREGEREGWRPGRARTAAKAASQGGRFRVLRCAALRSGAEALGCLFCPVQPSARNTCSLAVRSSSEQASPARTGRGLQGRPDEDLAWLASHSCALTNLEHQLAANTGWHHTSRRLFSPHPFPHTPLFCLSSCAPSAPAHLRAASQRSSHLSRPPPLAFPHTSCHTCFTSAYPH